MGEEAIKVSDAWLDDVQLETIGGVELTYPQDECDYDTLSSGRILWHANPTKRAACAKMEIPLDGHSFNKALEVSQASITKKVHNLTLHFSGETKKSLVIKNVRNKSDLTQKKQTDTGGVELELWGQLSKTELIAWLKN